MDADLRGFAEGAGIKLNILPYMPPCRSEITTRADHYKGFVITWVEPPVSAHKWVLNINAEDKAGLTKLGRTEVIKGATLDEAMAKAKRSYSAATSPRAGAPCLSISQEPCPTAPG